MHALTIDYADSLSLAGCCAECDRALAHMQGMGSWVSKFVDRNKNTITKVGGIVAVAAPVIPGVGLAISAAAATAAGVAALKVADAQKKDVAAAARKQSIWQQVEPLIRGEAPQLIQQVVNAINKGDDQTWAKIVQGIVDKRGMQPVAKATVIGPPPAAVRPAHPAAPGNQSFIVGAAIVGAAFILFAQARPR